MDSQPSANTYVLLDRYRAGDPSALDALLQRYCPRIARIVRVRMGAALRRRADADDVLQAVFVRIVESIDSYQRRDDATWIDWVARLVQREVSNLARHHGAQKRDAARELPLHGTPDGSAVEVAASGSSVVGHVSRRELEALLDQCVAELSEDHREVILLREYAGHDWRTIAELTGRPTSEACQELHRRARRELHQRWQDRYQDRHQRFGPAAGDDQAAC